MEGKIFLCVTKYGKVYKAPVTYGSATTVTTDYDWLRLNIKWTGRKVLPLLLCCLEQSNCQMHFVIMFKVPLETTVL